MNEKEENGFVIIDIDALFNCNIHWMLLKSVFKEDFFYGIKLCFIYLIFGHYRLNELLSPYLDPFNLDMFINQNVLEYLRLKSGKIYFCADMCESMCVKIFNDYDDVFDGYLCANKDANLSGLNKLLEITALVNNELLLYIGSSKKDLIIWEACDIIGVVIFNESTSLLKKIKKLNKEYIVLYAEGK